MPTERGAYPPWKIDETDPLLQERAAARKGAYEAAKARGPTERAARIEAAKADAETVRTQAGMGLDPSEAEYQRAVGERKKSRTRK